jgi:hypothetical protein
MRRGRWSLLGLLALYAGCSGESKKSSGDAAPAGGSDDAGAGVGARGGSGGAAVDGESGEGADATGGFAGVTIGGRAGSGGQGGTAGRSEGASGGSRPCSCSGLTGVRSDAMIICVNGACVLDPEDCRPERGDCNGFPEDGCEVRIDLDLSNCGACGVVCPNLADCNQGTCEFSPCNSGYARCGTDNECAPLDTEENCGVCGRRACTFENTIPTCSSTRTSCLPPLCLPGFANCSGDNACETPIVASGGGRCFPTELTSYALDVEGSEIHVGVGGDGATILAGYFTSRADFDPTGGLDERTPTNDEYSAFISLYSPSGAYSRTLTLDGGPSTISRVAVATDGSIVAAGMHRGTVDLDPGTGESLRGTGEGERGFVLGLRPDGTFAWAHSFTTSGSAAFSIATDVAVDATGAVTVSGYFSGTVDTDPDAPGGELVSETATIKPFVAKYASSGAFDWVWTCSGAGSASADRVSVASDRVWIAGGAQGECRFDGTGAASTGADESGAFVLGLSGDRSLTSFGLIEHASWLARITSTTSSTFLLGAAAEPLDLDPGPGVDLRIMSGQGAFAVKFASDGAFAWSQTFGRFEPIDAVATSAGGLLVAGSGSWDTNGAIDPLPAGVVLLVNADTSPGFTLALGANRYPRALATGGGVLAVAGQLTESAGQKYFLARYAFEN